MKRRTFIKGIAQAGVIAAMPRLSSGTDFSPSESSERTKVRSTNSSAQNPLAMNELRIPPVISGGNLTVAQTTYKIYSGTDTNVFSINNTFPAPTIKLRKGDTFTAKVINNLSVPTVIHWHGLHTPALMDGHPKNSIAPGGTFDVTYPITQRAGTFFYHSHADMNTAKQSYMGMTGCFIIEDDEEKALSLPSGDYDIPLIIQDKRFDANKQLDYSPKDVDMMSGWLGDTILVNGTPNAFLSVAPTLYRFRLVNASNSRMYKIAFSDGSQFGIIGNDGGLLGQLVTVKSAMLAPAERLDILLSLINYSQGSNITLQSLAFSYSGSIGSGTVLQGAPMDLLQLQVTKTGSSGSGIFPDQLSTIAPFNAADSKRTRTFELNGQHQINSQSFGMNRIDVNVPFGDLEQWTFINETEDPHPMHVHGLQFQIINPKQPSDGGWKDVVRVDSTQTMSVLLRYADYSGLYLVHCHNMEHEDMGMMANVQVGPSGVVKEENSEIKQVEITPNPASDQASLKFSPLAKEEILMIADEKGEIVLKEILPTGLNFFTILTTHFANGKYSVILGKLRASLLVFR